MGTSNVSVISNLNKIDAVIVLANYMDCCGVLNDESKARAVRAVEIFKDKKASALLTSGWAYRSDNHIPIAEVIKQYIISNFLINPDCIFADPNSRDTVGDAYFTKINFAIPFQWRHILVVTSNYHVERAQEIFDFIYGDNFIIKICAVEIDFSELTMEKEISSLEAFRRTFSGVKRENNSEIFSRLRYSHPFYNGFLLDKI